ADHVEHGQRLPEAEFVRRLISPPTAAAPAPPGEDAAQHDPRPVRHGRLRDHVLADAAHGPGALGGGLRRLVRVGRRRAGRGLLTAGRARRGRAFSAPPRRHVLPHRARGQRPRAARVRRRRDPGGRPRALPR
ncbi:hypothetical protein EG877_16655, partial [Enterococcus faecalis]